MDDLKNYKFGVFYFNRNDSRLLVPRKLLRMQGYTLNFAKPISFLLFGLFIILIICIIYSLSNLSFQDATV
ncbi:putative membrane protein [Pedobacter sp. CG_S7]